MRYIFIVFFYHRNIYRNINFRHEEDTDRTIAFLDIRIHHTIEGDIKIKIYRKPMHTDKYLLWTSEYPIAHKLSVVRTLDERAALTTDPKDRAQEEQHIQNALKTCQYPQWAIQKGTQQVKAKEETQTKERKKHEEQKRESREAVKLPYFRGRIQRVMKKHRINTPVKPHTKRPQLLVTQSSKLINTINAWSYMKYHVNHAIKPTLGRRAEVLPHKKIT